MHTLIVGMTGSGKSTYATQVANVVPYQRPIIILDPAYDDRWPDAAFVTDDIDEFEHQAREQINAWLFIDEGYGSIGASRWDNNLHWLFRTGRHYGHRVNVITQYPTDLPPVVRSQCKRLVAFNLDGDIAYRMARQYGCPALAQLPNLDQFEYLYYERGRRAAPILGKINPEKL